MRKVYPFKSEAEVYRFFAQSRQLADKAYVANLEAIAKTEKKYLKEVRRGKSL